MPNSIIAYQQIICLYISISLYVWQLLNLLVSKPSHVANQPLSCHAYVNSSIFLSNTYSIFMSPQNTQGFQLSSRTYVHENLVFGDEDVTILPLFKEFCPQNSSTYILKQNTDFLIFVFIFYLSRCFLNTPISPNNLNLQRFRFSNLLVFRIHNIYIFVNHQFFYTFHL